MTSRLDRERAAAPPARIAGVQPPTGRSFRVLRERVWDATVPAWQMDPASIDADPTEAQALDMAVTQALLQASDAEVERFIVRAAQDQEPQPWREASLVSNSTLQLSAQ